MILNRPSELPRHNPPRPPLSEPLVLVSMWKFSVIHFDRHPLGQPLYLEFITCIRKT